MNRSIDLNVRQRIIPKFWLIKKEAEIWLAILLLRCSYLMIAQLYVHGLILSVLNWFFLCLWSFISGTSTLLLNLNPCKTSTVPLLATTMAFWLTSCSNLWISLRFTSTALESTNLPYKSLMLNYARIHLSSVTKGCFIKQ